MKKKNRNSQLEILRIISIILIILHHAMIYTEWPENSSYVLNNYLVHFLLIGGKVGSNLFVILASWFLFEKDFKWSKYFQVWIPTIMYSVSIPIILFFIQSKPIDITNLIEMFMPVLTIRYWYVTNYILLLFFIPYLNMIIKNITKKEFQKIIIIMFIFFSVAPSLLGFDFGNDLIWFVFLFFITSYFRKYGEDIPNISNLFLMATSAVVFNFSSIIAMEYFKKINDEINVSSTFLSKQESFLLLILSISLFLIFIQLPVYKNSFVNFLSSTVFGIYLFHDNKFIRPILWENVFKLNQYFNQSNLIFYIVTTVFFVFFIGFIIELIRKGIELGFTKIYRKGKMNSNNMK